MGLVISWSNRANKDIEGIQNYYGPRADHRITGKLIKEVISATSILVDNPCMGPKEERLSHREKGFRYLVKGNYKIIIGSTKKKTALKSHPYSTAGKTLGKWA